MWIAVAFLLLQSKNRSFLLIRSSCALLIYLTLEVITHSACDNIIVSIETNWVLTK